MKTGPKDRHGRTEKENTELTTTATFTAITLTAAGVAAALDVRTRKIPNWLTFPAILLGLALNVASAGAAGLWAAVLGTAAGIALLLAPFAMGGMGAGDVKILAAVGALNGATFAFRTFVYGTVAGGVMAVLVITANWSFSLAPRSRSLEGASIRRVRAEKSFPYGVAIFVGTVAAYVLR